MATKKTETTGRPNRIRFVMLDADLSDGNLSELTQAITQALRPHNPTRLSPAPIAPIGTLTGSVVQGNGSEPAVAEESSDAEVAGDATSGEVSNNKPKKKYPPRVPVYLADLFSKDDAAAFKEFATQHPTDKDAMRYLVAAQWLQEHGQQSVNVDKMYTAYKTAGWPTSINDWDANFRGHVGNKSNKMRRVAPGEYVITPLGEAAVQAAKK